MTASSIILASKNKEDISVGLSDKSGLLKDMKKTFAKDQEMSEQGKGRKLRAGRGGDEEVEETHSEEILEAISL